MSLIWAVMKMTNKQALITVLCWVIGFSILISLILDQNIYDDQPVYNLGALQIIFLIILVYLRIMMRIEHESFSKKEVLMFTVGWIIAIMALIGIIIFYNFSRSLTMPLLILYEIIFIVLSIYLFIKKRDDREYIDKNLGTYG